MISESLSVRDHIAKLATFIGGIAESVLSAKNKTLCPKS